MILLLESQLSIRRPALGFVHALLGEHSAAPTLLDRFVELGARPLLYARGLCGLSQLGEAASPHLLPLLEAAIPFAEAGAVVVLGDTDRDVAVTIRLRERAAARTEGALSASARPYLRPDWSLRESAAHDFAPDLRFLPHIADLPVPDPSTEDELLAQLSSASQEKPGAPSWTRLCDAAVRWPEPLLPPRALRLLIRAQGDPRWRSQWRKRGYETALEVQQQPWLERRVRECRRQLGALFASTIRGWEEQAHREHPESGEVRARYSFDAELKLRRPAAAEAWLRENLRIHRRQPFQAELGLRMRYGTFDHLESDTDWLWWEDVALELSLAAGQALPVIEGTVRTDRWFQRYVEGWSGG